VYTNSERGRGSDIEMIDWDGADDVSTVNEWSSVFDDDVYHPPPDSRR